jgi:hypothetical protein
MPPEDMGLTIFPIVVPLRRHVVGEGCSRGVRCVSLLDTLLYSVTYRSILIVGSSFHL